MDNRCRFKRLGYVVLSVTDLERSADFYAHAVGLEKTSADRNEARFSCSENPYDVILVQGDEPGLARIAFELESEADLDLACRQLTKAKHPFQQLSGAESDYLGVSGAVRLTVPGCGARMELFWGRSERDEKFTPTVASIIRLGHVVIKTERFDEAFEFLTRLLNFQISDRIKSEDGGPHEVAFMRCFPNPYHHSLGLARANRNGLHHIALMVDQFDDIGKAVNRLPRAGGEIVFGPGRHVASGSVFLYFLDPDRMTIEYTLGMEEFSEIDPREARQLPPLPETVDSWGGQPKPNYATVGRLLPD